MKRPFEIYLLCVLLIFVSAGALYGSISLIFAPDGSILKMDPSWLENTPFRSFLVPGIILFLFQGVLPISALVGLLIKKQVPLFNLINIFKDKHWGWTITLYAGIASIIWIVVQQLLTSYFVLQPIIAGNGILIIIICLVPRIQKYYSVL